MPFPPINLHQRISSSPGRDLFRKKKPNVVPPPPEPVSKPAEEERDSDKEKLSTSWTAAANLRNLGRKPPAEKTKCLAQRPGAGPETRGKGSSWLAASPRAQDSRDNSGVTRSSSTESTNQKSGKPASRSSPGREVQFSLSLTPEAILVIQKRNMEKQMMAKQQTKCCGSADFRHRKVFPSSNRKAHGGGGSTGGCLPAARAHGGAHGGAQQDITAIVKISLLNEQHKYDDVEYEEEDGDVDETVVRKCKEWLKGVESAAAFGKVDKLSAAALPHLKGC